MPKVQKNKFSPFSHQERVKMIESVTTALTPLENWQPHPDSKALPSREHAHIMFTFHFNILNTIVNIGNTQTSKTLSKTLGATSETVWFCGYSESQTENAISCPSSLRRNGWNEKEMSSVFQVLPSLLAAILNSSVIESSSTTYTVCGDTGHKPTDHFCSKI